MTTSVKYPPRAAPALGFLNARRNDIEIFVEDSSTRNLWLNLLKGYLPVGIRLTTVNPLGSKQDVIDACRADQQDDGRRKLYIIDGDLDLVRGLPRPRLRYLFRLRMYCVENYLLDEDAFVDAVVTLDGRIDAIAVFQQLDFLGWFERNRRILRNLFICYAVSNELNEEVGTVRFSIHRLFRPGDANFDLCEIRVGSRIVGLYRSIRRNRSKHETRLVFDRVRQNADKLGVERFVSGKDYLFPPLYNLMKARFRITVSSNSFHGVVAQCLVRNLDPYLLRRIRSVCR